MTHSRSTARFAGLLAWLLLCAADGFGQETPEVEPPAADTAAADTAAAAIQEDEDANPFSGFETHFLSNGVKVWFRHLPGAPNVSVSAGVPVGSDADPPGKEQLAHFTEHMLFSDHDGRSEQEIKDAVESLGGQRNGFTYRDHTWYYVTIGQEHGLFAVEWLAGILSPHEMDPAVVDRGRQPVENEIRAQPRELFDHLWAALNPSWLAPPGLLGARVRHRAAARALPRHVAEPATDYTGGPERLLRPVLLALGHDRHHRGRPGPRRGARAGAAHLRVDPGPPGQPLGDHG